jgi:alpha-1,2-mannosyltransferase
MLSRAWQLGLKRNRRTAETGTVNRSAPDVAAVDPQRALQTALLGLAMLAAGAVLTVDLPSGGWGFDLHGILRGGHAILNGANPYPAPTVAGLVAQGNPFVLPPLLGLVAAPLSLLPFALAALIWNAASLGAVVTALRILDVHDPRVYLISLCSAPVIASLATGQPDGVFALLAAIAWRHRDDRGGALAVALMIAAKLVAWPLLLWLLCTRRLRLAATAAASAAAFLFAGWAAIGFAGAGSYIDLLAADARGFERRSHSIVALTMRLGSTSDVGIAAAAAVTICLASALVWRAGDRDLAGYTTAVIATLLLSPILWVHYLVLLLPVLAVRHRRLSWTWLLLVPMWLSPDEPAATGQVALVLAAALLIAWKAQAGGEAPRTGGGSRLRELEPSPTVA